MSNALTTAQSVPNLSSPVTVTSSAGSTGTVTSNSVLHALTQALASNVSNENDAGSYLCAMFLIGGEKV